MRIGIDATSLPAAISGAGQYILGLVGGLARCDTHHEFFIYCKRQHCSLFRGLPANFVIRRIPDYSRPRRLYWQHVALKSRLLADRIDLWHATHYVTPWRLQEIPTVTTIHDLAFFLFPQFYGFAKKHFFRRAIRQTLTSSAALVAVSETTRRDVRRLFPNSAHCHCVLSGLAVPGSGNTLPRHGEAEPLRRPFLLAVGTQERRKNFPFLVTVFRELAEEFPQLDLVIVGQPENDTARLQSEIDRLQLASRIHLPGYVSAARLQQYYRQANAFCHPAHYEGFGFPVLEALAAETPVLVADRPAMVEIGRGFVRRVAHNDVQAWQTALRQTLRAPPDAEKLLRGRTHALRFSWPRAAAHMIAIYEETAKGAARSVSRSAAAVPKLESAGLSRLEQAVVRTGAYADVFNFALTRRELHAGLIAFSATEADVDRAVDALFRRGIFERAGSFYFLPGRNCTVASRRHRLQLTRALLHKHARPLQRIVGFPFIRLVAISGAAAFGNCKPQDDIDLFIIAAPGRLWLAYTLLVIALKIKRLRRIFCLNYLVAEGAPAEERQNFYVAHQIAHLRALQHPERLQKYMATNGWIRDYLPQGGMPFPLHGEIRPVARRSFLMRAVERVLAHRLFDGLEKALQRLYERRIRRQTRHLGSDAIVVTDQKIMLFTNNHLYSVVNKYHCKLAALHQLISSRKENHHAGGKATRKVQPPPHREHRSAHDPVRG